MTEFITLTFKHCIACPKCDLPLAEVPDRMLKNYGLQKNSNFRYFYLNCGCHEETKNSRIVKTFNTRYECKIIERI